MTGQARERGHDIAAALTREHPRWLVIWGTHSREFWAFPMLAVPAGTFVHASDPHMLTTAMHEVELSVTQQPIPGWQANQHDAEGQP